MDSIYDKVGKRLKELRTQRGWTQPQLAEKASISVAFLSYLELGRRKGSLQTYEALAMGLGLPLHELLRFDRKERFSYPELPGSFPGLTAAESEQYLNLSKKIGRKRKPRH